MSDGGSGGDDGVDLSPVVACDHRNAPTDNHGLNTGMITSLQLQ